MDHDPATCGEVLRIRPVYSPEEFEQLTADPRVRLHNTSPYDQPTPVWPWLAEYCWAPERPAAD